MNFDFFLDIKIIFLLINIKHFNTQDILSNSVYRDFCQLNNRTTQQQITG